MKPYLVMLIGGMTAMQADAGALMTMKTQTADGEAVTSTITVDSDRVRMDDGKGGAAIYRGDREEMLIVNPGDKSYVVFDKAAADELVAQVSPALQEMREQLAQLPPEQRAMMEKMMGDRMQQMAGAGEPAAPPVVKVEASGETGSAMGVDCRWFDRYEDGELKQRACVAEPDAVPGSEQILAGMIDFSDFIREVMEPLRRQFNFPMPDTPASFVKDYGGMPVITEVLVGGGTVRSELVGSETVEVEAAAFEPPKGYREQKIM